MRKMIAFLGVLPLVLISCGALFTNPTPIVIVVTATPPPPPIPTIPPVSALVPSPVNTLTPIPTRVTVAEFEKGLFNNGYIRRPFSSPVRPGVEASSWDKENVWEAIYVYKDGYVRLEVLHTPSADTRAQHMEMKFQILDKIFPASFMSQLRQANDTYNKSGPSLVTGNCPHSWKYYDEWDSLEAQCNVSNSTIGSYPVAFALWYYQVTCPPQYEYCYYPSFGGQVFYGQSSFTFYTIEINIAP
jgi:hypothetical protein